MSLRSARAMAGFQIISFTHSPLSQGKHTEHAALHLCARGPGINNVPVFFVNNEDWFHLYRDVSMKCGTKAVTGAEEQLSDT